MDHELEGISVVSVGAGEARLIYADGDSLSLPYRDARCLAAGVRLVRHDKLPIAIVLTSADHVVYRRDILHGSVINEEGG